MIRISVFAKVSHLVAASIAYVVIIRVLTFAERRSATVAEMIVVGVYAKVFAANVTVMVCVIAVCAKAYAAKVAVMIVITFAVRTFAENCSATVTEMIVVAILAKVFTASIAIVIVISAVRAIGYLFTAVIAGMLTACRFVRAHRSVTVVYVTSVILVFVYAKIDTANVARMFFVTVVIYAFANLSFTNIAEVIVVIACAKVRAAGITIVIIVVTVFAYA